MNRKVKPRGIIKLITLIGFLKISVALIFIWILLSCSKSHSRSEVIEAMHTYDRLIQNMDADSIAALYTPDGELGEVAKGRDSIRNFLKTFVNVHVLANVSKSDSVILMGGDSAIQKGTYRQDVVLPNEDTAHLSGTFLAHWQWILQEGWRIKRMETTPINN